MVCVRKSLSTTTRASTFADLQLGARSYRLQARRYLVGERLTTEGGEVDFDVMTELVFSDRRAFDAWMAELAKPGVGTRIVEDEEKFLNRARTRAYVIEERTTRE
jgi:EthD domain